LLTRSRASDVEIDLNLKHRPQSFPSHSELTQTTGMQAESPGGHSADSRRFSSRLSDILRRRVVSLLGEIEHGRIHLTDENGFEQSFGSGDCNQPIAEIVIHDKDVWRDIALRGTMVESGTGHCCSCNGSKYQSYGSDGAWFRSGIHTCSKSQSTDSTQH